MAATNTLGKEARDAGSQVGKWIAARSAPFLPPWLLLGVLGGAAAVGHAHFADNTAATAVMGAASTAVTAATWQEASRRSPRLRGHATATVAAATGYLTAGTVAGPLTGGVGTLYTVGGAALALSWNVRYALRNSAESEAGGGDLLGKVGMAKTHVISSKVEGSRVEALLQLPPGEVSPEEAQRKAALIAGAAGVPATAVRIAANPDNHSQVKLSLVAQDVLKKPTPWPGPSAPGGSVGKPVVLGVAEDGLALEFYLPGDPEAQRNASHMLWVGMNGSGKTEAFMVMAGELLTRSDVLLWFADPAKGAQTSAEIADAVDWLACGPAEVKEFIGALPHVIRARADELGRLGYKQWVPAAYAKHRIPLVVAHIEEGAAGVVSDHPDLPEIAQQARSVGIILSLSLQRASHTNLSTDVRSEFGRVIMFGCKSQTDAGMALDDAVIEAGAAPWAWQNTKPGYCYVQSTGIAAERWPMPNRTFYLDPSTEYRAGLRTMLGRFKGVRAVADAVTARSAGSAYAAYRAQAKTRAAQARSGVPAARTAAAGGTADGVGGAEVVDVRSTAGQRLATRLASATAETLPQILAWAATLSDEELAAGLAMDAAADDMSDVDVDADLPALPQDAAALEFAEPAGPVRELMQDEAQAELVALIDAMEADGHTRIGPSDIAHRWQGRSRSWVSRTLGNLVDEGRLRETGRAGRYDIVPRGGYAA